MSGTKEDLIKYRIERYIETFEDAISLAGLKRWNSCINRLYYSSFYLLTALLLKNNIKAETHKGVKTQFSHHFVKTGIINFENGKFYAKLFDIRQVEDYKDFVNYDEETVMPLIA